MDWQPIETAPKDGTAIIIYPQMTVACFGDYGSPYGYPPRKGVWLCECYPDIEMRFSPPDDDEQPTHWMPLPEPPDGTEA